MKQKLVRVPFDVELAKKITNKEIEGRIVTRDGENARILCFDAKGRFPIVALIESEDEEMPVSYTSSGFYQLNETPKLGCTLMLETPEYMTFKNGDIYESGTFILKSIDGKDRVEYYANLYAPYTAFDSACLMKNLVNHLRYATDEEKQKLIDALKASKEPRAKEYLKRFFGIEEKPKCEFKPFDKVLVRDENNECWHATFFSHKNRGGYNCVGCTWNQCIPYNEQTAHLLGTTDDWEG